jgi:hypothetical protein
MFSVLRRRLTYTNVGVTLALFFSMSGGALAASHYLITSTKQIKPSVLSALKGKAGAAGAAGANGANGAVGPQGLQGPEGKAAANGAAGESVVSAALKPKEGGCAEGGSKFTVGGKETTACNGKNGTNGTTGFTETLPEGKTETGTWSYGTAKTEGTDEYATYQAFVPMSFNVPLGAGLAESNVHFLTEHTVGCGEPQEPAREQCKETDKTIEEREKANKEACPGSAAAPTAEPGNLCVYVTYSGVSNGTILGFVFQTGVPFVVGAGTTGAVLALTVNVEGTIPHGGSSAIENVAGYGTWAVTAPKKEK